MHIGLLRKKRQILVRPGRRLFYDLLTTRRFRLTEYKIACIIMSGLCAIQHFWKFLKFIKTTRLGLKSLLPMQ